ncbi:MAG: hypothetical protein NW226_03490 [Microscillaceae bacterium]|nr:hypothetical protein [Microscillaceae bacterium]
MEKKKIIKDYEKLSDKLKKALRKAYPDGYTNHMISYFDGQGKHVFMVPLETEEFIYMVRLRPEKIALYGRGKAKSKEDEGTIPPKDDFMDNFPPANDEPDWLDG